MTHNKLWGDEFEGARYAAMLKKKFGDEPGARKAAMSALKISRRLLNLYMSGHRKISADAWAKLRAYQPALAAPRKEPKTARYAAYMLYIDDIDPLS